MSDWPASYGRVLRDEVSSTFDAAQALAQAQDQPASFWLLAHRQTAARGRRGRPWKMPQGNFAATLVLYTEEPPARVALRSFVMSLALSRAFGDLTGQVSNYRLKWPNDVLQNEGKIAGILLETAGQGQVSIGVGVNLAAAPGMDEVEERALTPVALTPETGVVCPPEAFLDVLAVHYATLEHQFQTYGFSPIRTAWLAHAARLGEPITARVGQEIMTGIFEDVDEEGHLVLRGPRGVRSIAAADVYF